MPDIVNAIFVLYLLISIVSGVLSAMRKRGQTAPPGRRRIGVPRMPSPPVIVAEPFPPVVETPPTTGPEAAETPAVIEPDGHGTDLPADAPAELVADQEEADAGYRSADLLKPSTADLLRASRAAIDDELDDEIDADDDDVGLGDLPGRGVVDEVTLRPVHRSPAVGVAHLLADRNQLKDVFVAMEVLGKPKALRM